MGYIEKLVGLSDEIYKAAQAGARWAVEHGYEGVPAIPEGRIQSLLASIGEISKIDVNREYPELVQAGIVKPGAIGAPVYDALAAPTRVAARRQPDPGTSRRLLEQAWELRQRAKEGQSFKPKDVEAPVSHLANPATDTFDLEWLDKAIRQLETPVHPMGAMPLLDPTTAGAHYPVLNTITWRPDATQATKIHELMHNAIVESPVYPELITAVKQTKEDDLVKFLYPFGAHPNAGYREHLVKPNEAATEIPTRILISAMDDEDLVRKVLAEEAEHYDFGTADTWFANYAKKNNIPEQMRKPLKKLFKNSLFALLGTAGVAAAAGEAQAQETPVTMPRQASVLDMQKGVIESLVPLSPRSAEQREFVGKANLADQAKYPQLPEEALPVSRNETPGLAASLVGNYLRGAKRLADIAGGLYEDYSWTVPAAKLLIDTPAGKKLGQITKDSLGVALGAWETGTLPHKYAMAAMLEVREEDRDMQSPRRQLAYNRAVAEIGQIEDDAPLQAKQRWQAKVLERSREILEDGGLLGVGLQTEAALVRWGEKVEAVMYEEGNFGITFNEVLHKHFGAGLEDIEFEFDDISKLAGMGDVGKLIAADLMWQHMNYGKAGMWSRAQVDAAKPRMTFSQLPFEMLMEVMGDPTTYIGGGAIASAKARALFVRAAKEQTPKEIITAIKNGKLLALYDDRLKEAAEGLEKLTAKYGDEVVQSIANQFKKSFAEVQALDKAPKGMRDKVAKRLESIFGKMRTPEKALTEAETLFTISAAAEMPPAEWAKYLGKSAQHGNNVTDAMIVKFANTAKSEDILKALTRFFAGDDMLLPLKITKKGKNGYAKGITEGGELKIHVNIPEGFTPSEVAHEALHAAEKMTGRFGTSSLKRHFATVDAKKFAAQITQHLAIADMLKAGKPVTERMHAIVSHTDWYRRMLDDLPLELRNARNQKIPFESRDLQEAFAATPLADVAKSNFRELEERGYKLAEDPEYVERLWEAAENNPGRVGLEDMFVLRADIRNTLMPAQSMGRSGPTEESIAAAMRKQQIYANMRTEAGKILAAGRYQQSINRDILDSLKLFLNKEAIDLLQNIDWLGDPKMIRRAIDEITKHINMQDEALNPLTGWAYETRVKLVQRGLEAVRRNKPGVRTDFDLTTDVGLAEAVLTIQNHAPKELERLKPIMQQVLDMAKDKPKVWEYFAEYMRNSMLSAPGTHMVNFAASPVRLMGLAAEKTLAGIADYMIYNAKMVAGLEPKRNALASEGVTLLRNMPKYFRLGAARAKDIILHGTSGYLESTHHLADVEVSVARSAWDRINNKFWRKMAPWIANGNLRVMGAVDAMWRTAVQGAIMEGIARRYATRGAGTVEELLANPTAGMIAEAQREARRVVFLGEPGKVAESLLGLRNRSVIGHFVLPFVYTASRIALQGINRLPVVGAVGDAVKYGKLQSESRELVEKAARLREQINKRGRRLQEEIVKLDRELLAARGKTRRATLKGQITRREKRLAQLRDWTSDDELIRKFNAVNEQLGNISNRMGRVLPNAISKQLAGLGLAAIGYGMWDRGILVGSAPDDAQARELFYRKYGGEWRVNLYGDYWFPIMDVLGPYAYPIVFGASWAENWEKYNFNREHAGADADVLDIPVGMFADLWDTTTDFTFVRTLNHFAGKGADVAEQIGYTAGSITGSFVPESAMVRNIVRAIEAYGGGVQISERFENLPEAFVGGMYRSIGLNHGELPPRIDYRGRKVQRVSSDVPELRALFEFMSAYRPNFDMLDRYDREMVKLAMFKTVPQRKLRGYTLSDQEYETYATVYGEATDRAIRAVVDDPYYDEMNTLQKRRAVDRAIDRYRAVARKRFIATLSYDARKRMIEYKNEIPATPGWNSRRMTKDSVQNSEGNFQGDAPF